MKDPFSTTSTTSIVAVLLVLSCMGLLYFVTGASVPKDDTTRTQIVQGVFGLLMMLAGYYFGASKQRAVTQNADTISNAPAVGNDGEVTQTTTSTTTSP